MFDLKTVNKFYSYFTPPPLNSSEMGCNPPPHLLSVKREDFRLSSPTYTGTVANRIELLQFLGLTTLTHFRITAPVEPTAFRAILRRIIAFRTLVSTRHNRLNFTLHLSDQRPLYIFGPKTFSEQWPFARSVCP